MNKIQFFLIMIHVLITVKESERFPGKNRLLWGYTQAWVAQEMQGILEDVRVWVVGEVGPFLDLVPGRWRVLCFHEGDHGRLQALAEAEILKLCADEVDDGVEPVFVLCQLTQPLRRRGLLADMARCARAMGSAVSVTDVRRVAWREKPVPDKAVDRRPMCEVADASWVPCVDGACYAWLPGKSGESRQAGAPERGRMYNRAGWPVDVDERQDLPLGLELEWARLMVEGPGKMGEQWRTHEGRGRRASRIEGFFCI